MNGQERPSVRLCGCMKIEDSSHKFSEERYFELDLDDHRLNIYYDNPRVSYIYLELHTFSLNALNQ